MVTYLNDKELANTDDNGNTMIPKFKLVALNHFENKDEARQFAIEWQAWFSRVSLSYDEVNRFQHYFLKLAEKFNLIDEFKENGII